MSNFVSWSDGGHIVVDIDNTLKNQNEIIFRLYDYENDKELSVVLSRKKIEELVKIMNDFISQND